MLVGFSEELMFRGIVLYAFKADDSVLKEIVVSAVCFSALHSVNVFGGSPVIGVIAQLGLTFIFGMCFAPLAIKIQNIWPLIIFDWLWDFILISGSVFGHNNNFFSTLGILLNIILAIVLWVSMKKK